MGEYLQVFWSGMGSLVIALFRLVGSKQMHSFKLPDLSLLSTSTKLLTQGVASWTGLSTPACSILSTFLNCVFEVDRNWVARRDNTWMHLYIVGRSWEATNPFKAIREFMQNLIFACDQLGNCILAFWHLSSHFICRSLSGHLLPLDTPMWI